MSWFMRRGNGPLKLDHWNMVKLKMAAEPDLIAVVTNPVEYTAGLDHGIDKKRLTIVSGIRGTGLVYLFKPDKLKNLI